jgi:hypothetical protein
MQEFRIGDVLSRSFSIFFKNFVPFMLLTAIVYTPLIVMAVRASQGDVWGGMEGEEDTIEGFVTNIGTLLLQLVASAAVMYGVIQQLRGQHANMGACLAMGVRRLLPVIGSGLLMILAIGLGFIALVIPGIIVYLILYVTIPVTVIERPGVFAALSRSSDLTKGYKGHIFLIVLLLWLLGFGLTWVAGNVQESLPSSVGLVVSLTVNVFTGALGAVVSAVVYHDLRAIKEGVNVDDLVRVFE